MHCPSLVVNGAFHLSLLAASDGYFPGRPRRGSIAMYVTNPETPFEVRRSPEGKTGYDTEKDLASREVAASAWHLYVFVMGKGCGNGSMRMSWPFLLNFAFISCAPWRKSLGQSCETLQFVSGMVLQQEDQLLLTGGVSDCESSFVCCLAFHPVVSSGLKKKLVML
eukprot:s3998_g2.t1